MFNLPNVVTLSRLLALPLMFVFLQTPESPYRIWGLVVFALAAATDWLDGYLARRLNQVTELGKFLDPLVDKLLVLGALLILVQWRQLPAWAVFIILAREVMIAGWRVTPNLNGQAEIQGANLWGKLKTVTQILAIAWLMAPLPTAWAYAGLPLFWLAVAMTIISGVIYVIPTDKLGDFTTTFEK